MTILKKHVKILRYVRRYRVVLLSMLDQKYGHDVIRDLLRSGYLTCKDDHRRTDEEGYLIGEYSPSDLISLTTSGLSEVVAHDWFDFEFLVKSFLFPIAVSIATTLITLFLKGVL